MLRETLFRSVPRLLLLVLAFSLAGNSIARVRATVDSINVLDSTLSDTVRLKGKVVYLDFWASWCPYCQKSFPCMNQLANRYQKDGLQIVAVNMDKDRQSARQFIDKMKPTFEIIFDSTGVLATRFGVKAMPTSFIYGRDGRLRSRHEGFRVHDTLKLDSLVRSLLGNEPSN